MIPTSSQVFFLMRINERESFRLPINIMANPGVFLTEFFMLLTVVASVALMSFAIDLPSISVVV